MDNSNYFKDMFESIQDYKKIVLLFFLIQNDESFLKGTGFSKYTINRLSIEFKKILLGEYEVYLSFVKNEEESIIEKILS